MYSTPLLFLHGALGSAEGFNTLQPLFDEAGFETLSLNFSGHGGKPFGKGQFSIEGFATEVLAFLDEKGISQADIFGYSMGGYVALYLARHYPGRAGKIATLATKFDWREETAAKEAAMLNPEKILEKVPRFAEMLAQRHAPQDWKELMEKTASMMLNLGKSPSLSPEDFSRISQQVLLAAGDQDKTASPEETLATYRTLPNASMWIIPATPHPLEKVDSALLAEGLKRFFRQG